MPEQDQVIFPPEPLRPPGRGRSLAVRIAVVAGSVVLFVVGAVAVMGASPLPSASDDPGASSQPTASSDPSPSSDPAPSTSPHHAKPAPSADPNTGAPAAPNGPKGAGPRAGFPGRFGFGGVGPGLGVGRRDITITAINGSDVSLKTEDGWTRTIAVTSGTTITKGGATIPVSDLNVGDQVRIAEKRNDDGTYAVTQIHVVQPTIGGRVTAIDGSTITVTVAGGTIAKIHVNADTKISVDGTAGAKVSDIKVNSFVIAEGTQRSDGSLDASTVHSGLGLMPGKGGPGHPGGRHGAPDSPKTSPAPSTSAG